MSPEDLAANREMVRDLNKLIRETIGGGEPDATEFLQKHGRFFPGAQTFDDVIDQLAQRMAAMQSLMRSMSPEQRAELQSMMEALLRDDRLLLDLAQLASNLDLLLPGGLGTGCRSAATSRSGSRVPLPRSPGSRRSTGSRTPCRTSTSPGDLGSDRSRGGLATSSARTRARELDALDDLARRLEEAGYLTRDGQRLELTPRGSRQDRPEGPRRPVRPAAAGRVRRPPDRPGRAGRGARGDDEAVRVRRPVPPRPPRDACSTRWAARRTRRRPGQRAATGESASLRRTSRSSGPRC